MNASMFLPQIAEDDLYDSSGKQLDDVNSVIEYFQVALGYDHHVDDEDDDNGQNFHLVKNVECNFQQCYFAPEPAIVSSVSPPVFYHTDERNFRSISMDIISPPPDLLSI
ncbi:MAG: hypothetical protein JWR61_4424 [Ferruginibacter sp.]|uniref:hypothetical protein n=1 Tax=Ferruginibacter sp. TaxID=1940288 RepID=UPI00265A6685|nr:hypothetical protein [Ferruginibacter sp.]MDB5279469.1 hypothetical protein [Ferruginibacter sp.]